MFGNDLTPRVDKLERDVEALKRIEVEVVKNSMAIASLSEKVDARFAAVDVRFTSLENRFISLEASLGRLQMFIYGTLIVLIGGIFTVSVLPNLKAYL